MIPWWKWLLTGSYSLFTLFFLLTKASIYSPDDPRYRHDVLAWKTFTLWVPIWIIWTIIGSFWLFLHGKTFKGVKDITWKWWEL